jgi:hypothetical protein
VSYEDGNNSAFWSCFLILASRPFVCCIFIPVGTVFHLNKNPRGGDRTLKYNNQKWGSYHVLQACIFSFQPPVDRCCLKEGDMSHELTKSLIWTRTWCHSYTHKKKTTASNWMQNLSCLLYIRGAGRCFLGTSVK